MTESSARAQKQRTALSPIAATWTFSSRATWLRETAAWPLQPTTAEEFHLLPPEIALPHIKNGHSTSTLPRALAERVASSTKAQSHHVHARFARKWTRQARARAFQDARWTGVTRPAKAAAFCGARLCARAANAKASHGFGRTLERGVYKRIRSCVGWRVLTCGVQVVRGTEYA
mmetsp:Transcript_14900/g.39925  ORF Transcript_14900/g.39925 Transcript_14900/m.39925 type:complete len:174 (-) Transcript_14900:138-659(-)